jgi:preprotein translocase subunit SecF
MTSITTLTAIIIVYVVAVVFNITSVQGFALPMMIGIISGCYSSLCIAGPLWVMWQNHKKAKKVSLKK